MRAVRFLTILGLCLGVHAQALGKQVYYIGNSLTFDANPYSITSMALSYGDSGATFDNHIRCGSSLNDIVTHPTETCVATEAYGTFGQALPNHAWDAVTIQPFPRVGSTLATDIAAINSMMGLAIGSPTPYVYSAYPGLVPGQTYAQQWLRPSSGLDGQETILSRAYFDDVMQRVHQTLPNARMVPLGEVFYEVEAAALRGELTGFDSISDFYRDDLHLNNVGRFIAGTTMFATLYGADPTGMPMPTRWHWYYAQPETWPNDQTISPELRTQLQSIVWDVVSTHEYSGVPEPSSVVLLVGCAAFVISRRKRRPV